MLNVDMVGRQSGGQVSVCDLAPDGGGGGDSGSSYFHALHDSAGLGFAALDHDIDRYMQRSDQYPFFQRGIPVIFFFEGLSASGGLNPDYHRVSDTPDKLDYDKMERVARLVYRHVMGAASGTPL
jgi:Zn-dependent M28 family amino/carboxypeptidase